MDIDVRFGILSNEFLFLFGRSDILKLRIMLRSLGCCWHLLTFVCFWGSPSKIEKNCGKLYQSDKSVGTVEQVQSSAAGERSHWGGQIQNCCLSLSIQVCPKKGINPTMLLWGWDWDHQTYSREGYGSLGFCLLSGVICITHYVGNQAKTNLW